MKTKIFLTGILGTGLLISTVTAQLPDTDIFLVKMSKDKSGIVFSTPENLTHRKGYDNQPCFSDDGKKLLYVAIYDTTQSDIYSIDLKSRHSVQVTSTPESEYSPTYTMDGNSLTVVRVDQDSGQRAYNLPLISLTNSALIKGTDSIGYFCWLNDTSFAMFILGPSMTLQVLNTRTAQRTLIAGDVGRCLKLSPNKKSLYFVLKSNEKEWYLYSMDISTLKTERLTATLPGSEDYAVLPDGTLLMGSEGKIYSWKPGQTEPWKQLADFSSSLHSFYRIAVSPDGTQLALVAFTGVKP